jgi:hypothetical protein
MRTPWAEPDTVKTRVAATAAMEPWGVVLTHSLTRDPLVLHMLTPNHIVPLILSACNLQQLPNLPNRPSAWV